MGFPAQFPDKKGPGNLTPNVGVSSRVLRRSAGFCGRSRDFPRVGRSSDPMLLPLGNCWSVGVGGRELDYPSNVVMCRGFLLYGFLEDFAGDFPGGFFWALFPAR